MSSGSPAVARALLTKYLRSRRIIRGEKLESVARALDWSLSKVIRIENGTVGVSKTDLEALLRHYEVDDQALVQRMIGHSRDARTSGWWDKYHLGDKAFQAYLGFEAEAAMIRNSQGLVIPGLLQTESYARRIISSYAPNADPDPVVRLRLDRQEAVFGRGVVQIHVLDEAVIRRNLNAVMPEQLRHLIEMSERPEVSIRVIPFAAGPHFGMRGPFTLLAFDVDLDDILFLESARRGDLLIPPTDVGDPVSRTGSSEGDTADQVAEYQDGFASLLKVALEPQDSRKLIELVAREIS